MPKKASGKYRVMNPRRTPTGELACPSGRNLLILDGQSYNEGDTYEPPPGKDIQRLLDGGFLEEDDGRRDTGEAVGDLPALPASPGRSRRVVTEESPAVSGEVGDD